MENIDEILEEITDDEDFIELVQQELRAPRVFRPRENHFEKWNDEEFKDRFRVSKHVAQYLIDKISHLISSPTAR